MLKTRFSARRRAKLQLHGETIALLTDRQLHAVVGGYRDTLVECTVMSLRDDCPVSAVSHCDVKSDDCPKG